MSQKRNRRTVIIFNNTYKVTFEPSIFQNIIDKIGERIHWIFMDFKVQTVFPQAVVINKTKNKAKRF